MDPIATGAATDLILDKGVVGALMVGFFGVCAIATRLWFVWRNDVASFEAIRKAYEERITVLQDKRIEDGRAVVEQVLKSTAAMDGMVASNERISERVERLSDSLNRFDFSRRT